MKTIKLTTVILSTLVMLGAANSSLEANQRRPQEIIAIQIDKPAPKDIKRVQVQERENVPKRVCVRERGADRVQVQKRPKQCGCEFCQRRIKNHKRPEYHGRVPVGRRVGRYGQGVVIHPSGRTPQKVFVHPSPPCHCQDEYSISWSVSIHR